MLCILTPESGLLFRITHVANLPWLLQHGLHAANSEMSDPNFVAIGNPGLVDRRSRRSVPLAPGGAFPDYVPFYFTPRSPMLFNIRTGYNGVTKRPNEEIAVLVSSCKTMAAAGIEMLYTDRHAYAATASWTASAFEAMSRIDWDILQRHDFSRDDCYPDKRERYQAEALAHRRVPPDALRGIGCVSDTVSMRVERVARMAGSAVRVVTRPGWFFP